MRESLARHAMLRPGDRVGIAVSGGADSVALALLLRELHKELAIESFIVHFNHQLRGAESDGDERFVREFAAALGLEFVSAREDVAARAKEHGWSLEDAGRRLRYEFFASLVTAKRATRIAVAHTADDQAETVIAHIVRGTGPTGLAAIYPVAGNIVRPMLHVRRAQLREFLKSRGQAWREDASNADETRLRARIRRRLLPMMETDFQPWIVEHLSKLSDLAREDEDFWCLLVEDRFRALARESDAGIEVEVDALIQPFHSATAQIAPNASHPHAAQLALSKRLLRRILEEIRGARSGFTSGHIESILALATQSSSGRKIELPGGIVVEKSFAALRFSCAERAATHATPQKSALATPTFSHPLPLEAAAIATVEIPEIGHRLSLKSIDWPSATRDTIHQAIDWGSLRAPLMVRNWQPGDAFRPHGRLRTHKLKELFQAKRVPLRERSAWPVLTSAGSVVWARGFPVAQDFVAGSTNRRSVIVIEEPL